MLNKGLLWVGTDDASTAFLRMISARDLEERSWREHSYLKEYLVLACVLLLKWWWRIDTQTDGHWA